MHISKTKFRYISSNSANSSSKKVLVVIPPINPRPINLKSEEYWSFFWGIIVIFVLTEISKVNPKSILTCKIKDILFLIHDIQKQIKPSPGFLGPNRRSKKGIFRGQNKTFDFQPKIYIAISKNGLPFISKDTQEFCSMNFIK